MGKDTDYITIEITIEQAIKAIIRSFGDDEKAVIISMATQILLSGFHLFYKKYKITIPEQESVHVECCMPGGAVAGYLFDVAEKGWENVYVDPNPGNTARIFSIDLITKTKGNVIVPKKEIKKNNPETGKEEIICIEGEIRDIKRVVEKYTGEPIIFKKFKARIAAFEKLRNENNMPIPDYWLPGEEIKEHSSIGGSRNKVNEALQEAINRIVAEIEKEGDRGTVGNFKSWFEKKGAVFHTETALATVEFITPIPNCDDIYIDGNKLVWKNRDGVEEDMAITSLRTYLDRARVNK